MVEGENLLLSFAHVRTEPINPTVQEFKTLERSVFYRISILLVAIFILSTGKAVFAWPLGSTQMVFAVFSPIIITLSLLTVDYRSIPVVQFSAASAVVLVYLSILMPVRQFDSGSLSFLMPLLIAPIMLMRDRHIRRILDAIALLVAISSVSALAVFLVNLVGLDLPWVRLGQNFRFNSSDYYRLYPGSLVLSTQIWDVGPITIIRTSGLFREPGHMAMISSGILVANGMDLSRRRYKLTLVGGLLTMSPAFFGLVSVFALLKFFGSWRERLRIIIAVPLLAALGLGFVFIAPEALYERIVGNNLSMFLQGGMYEVFNERTRGDFDDFYPLLSFSDRLFGIGIGAFAGSGFEDTTVSDYRGFIVMFGIRSLLALAGLILFLGLRSNSNRQLAMSLVFFCVVALHRSWMMTSMWFPLFLAFGAILAFHEKRRPSTSFNPVS